MKVVSFDDEKNNLTYIFKEKEIIPGIDYYFGEKFNLCNDGSVKLYLSKKIVDKFCEHVEWSNWYSFRDDNLNQVTDGFGYAFHVSIKPAGLFQDNKEKFYLSATSGDYHVWGGVYHLKRYLAGKRVRKIIMDNFLTKLQSKINEL